MRYVFPMSVYTSQPATEKAGIGSKKTGVGSKKTEFGSEKSAFGDKQKRVRDVFDKVAPRYDVMNDLMSGGAHRLWKARLIEWLYLPPVPSTGQHILLDVAGGTGDIAFRAARATDRLRVHVIDINESMLRVGRTRKTAKRINNKIHFTAGSAENLPLPTHAVDFVSLAFGIRNMSSRARALREIFRVLRPGGRFVCLEFSQKFLPFLEKPYTAYASAVIPRLGAGLAGSHAAYQYLVDSIGEFPPPDLFADEIEAAGFSRVRFAPLSGGIAALHGGWRV